MTDTPISSARQLLTQYEIQNPTEVPIEELIWAQGCIYDEKLMTGAEGRIIFQGSSSAIIVINKNITHPAKKRFVQAHELGHLRLHRLLQPFFHCNAQVFLERNKLGSHESEANAFAAELLMPNSLIQPLFQAKEFNINLLKDIAHRFKTSLTATAFRYIELGAVPIAVFYSANGQIEWAHRSADFIANGLTIKVPLPKLSVTYRCLIERVAPSQPELVPAAIWFNCRRVPNDLLFYEDCVLFPRYGGALSFLWMSAMFMP